MTYCTNSPWPWFVGSLLHRSSFRQVLFSVPLAPLDAATLSSVNGLDCKWIGRRPVLLTVTNEPQQMVSLRPPQPPTPSLCRNTLATWASPVWWIQSFAWLPGFGLHPRKTRKRFFKGFRYGSRSWYGWRWKGHRAAFSRTCWSFEFMPFLIRHFHHSHLASEDFSITCLHFYPLVFWREAMTNLSHGERFQVIKRERSLFPPLWPLWTHDWLSPSHPFLSLPGFTLFHFIHIFTPQSFFFLACKRFFWHFGQSTVSTAGQTQLGGSRNNMLFTQSPVTSEACNIRR